MLHLLLIISLPRWYLSPSLLLHALFSCIRCIRLPHSLNKLCCFLRLPAAFMPFDYSCCSSVSCPEPHKLLSCFHQNMFFVFYVIRSHTSTNTPSSCICLNVDLLILCLNMPECNVELLLLAETLSTSNTEIHHLPDQYSIFLNLPACPFTASVWCCPMNVPSWSPRNKYTPARRAAQTHSAAALLSLL